MNKSRITHIIEASATGTLSMVLLLANAQAEKGNLVEVIYSKRPETPQNFEELFASTIKVTNLQMHGNMQRIKSIFRLRYHLMKSAPKTIFLHSSFAGFLGRIATIGQLSNTKFFYIPHCISFMRKDISVPKRFLFILFEWFGALKKCDYIACSASERREIQDHIPFRSCHLVENAIDMAVPTLPESQRNSKVVISVGQIRPQKSPTLYARIAKIVKARNPDIEFVWVGDGDIESKKLLLEAGVSVRGWLPKSLVLKELSASGIYLSTAQWEGMPVSLIEAMISGLPIVASRCAGNIDIVDHQKNGWLYESAQEAAELIFNIINNPVLAQSVAQRAKSHAIERFSPERYLKEIEIVTN